MIESSKENLDSLALFIDTSDQESLTAMEKMRGELSVRYEFWEIMKDPVTAIPKIATAFKSHQFYLEFCCKCFKRMIEMDADIKIIIDQINSLSLNNTAEWTEAEKLIEKIKIDDVIEYKPGKSDNWYESSWRAELGFLKALSKYIQRRVNFIYFLYIYKNQVKLQ